METGPVRGQAVTVGSGQTRLRIDWTTCDGRGLCTELLPEILDRDEWGYPLSRKGEREPVVPHHLRRYADEAVAQCPLLALTVVS